MADALDVAIVGGGPAGAATAIHLARLGYRVAIFERHATPRWRACGVFASPLVRKRLETLAMAPELIAKLHRSISAMELSSTRGASCRLEYRHGFACGFDRVALDAALLDQAQQTGADVRRGTVVRDVILTGTSGALQVVVASALADDEAPSPELVSARIVVGADGGGSRVARAAGALSGRHWLGRSGITFHVHDANAAPAGQAMTGRFVLGESGYVGIAPVPGERVNVGIVVPTARLRDGVESVIGGVLGDVAGKSGRWSSAARTDAPQVAGQLEHHVTRAAGEGWLLVGDAIEFIDPLTGEGLHRALKTAGMAAESIDRRLSGDRSALAVYDRRVRSRFRSKNLFTLVLQAFIANPRVLDYALRRLDRRTDLRDELTGVLADQSPASRALDPRFMARLLAP